MAHTPDEDYRLLFDRHPQPMLVFDATTLEILHANQSAVKKFGFSPDLLQSNALSAIFANETPSDLHTIQSFHEQQQQLIKGDGTIVPVVLDAFSTTLADRPAGVLLISDASEQHSTEEALSMTEAKLRTLMDTTVAGIFFYRGDHFSFVNHAMSTITGYSQEELLHTPIWDLIHPDQREMVKQRAYARQRGEAVPSRYQVMINHHDGAIRWLDLSVNTIEVQGEKALMGTLIDVTDRHLAEKGLRISEERYHALYEHNPLMCFTLDSQFVIQDVNETGADQLGCTKQELLGASFLERFHEEDRSYIAESFRACLLNDTKSKTSELRLHCTAGNTIYVSVVAQSMTDVHGKANILAVCEDITERRAVQERLLVSEEQFRSLAEATPAAIFFYQGDHFKYANVAMERITGYSKSELEVMRFIDIVHPDDKPLIRSRSHANAQGKMLPSSYELRILSKSGEVHWLEIVPSVVEFRHQKSLMGTAVDITERKRVEEELRRSEEMTHRIIEAVPGGIIEVALDGTIRQANIEAQQFFGISPLQFLQFNVQNLIAKAVWEDNTPVGRDEFIVQKCLATGNEQPPATMGIRRPDNSLSWGVFSAIPLIDIASGLVSGAVLTFLDITARKHTEDALRESEERYRKFFEEDLTGDFIASHDGTILACNPAFATMFGFESVEEATLANLHTIYAEENAFESITNSLNRERKIEYHEAVGRQTSGRPVYIIENLIGLFDSAGTLIGIKGYVFDNTAHKVLEQQVLEAAKIEGLGRLAGGIAHDFNNLLGIIIGYSERLAKQTDGSKKRMKDVEAIQTAAHRGTSLVKQLLTFARKTDVSFEEMNLNTVVDEIAKLLSETFPRNISLKVDSDPALPLIIGDANQIHQAVLNLCVNARDAMPSGGTLTLQTELATGFMLRERFPEASADFYACVSASDTGIGINEETRRKIFEPFFSTKERGRGTGLGLAVVHGIVKAHRGIIEVLSESGRGTTFKLFLPLPALPTRTTMKEEEPHHEVPGGTETILIVEDEELLRELVQSLLETKGYSILTARDGMEAVEIFAQNSNRVELVLTDLGLPRLGGWEACQQMQSINPKLKIVVATGYLDPSAKQEMLDGGVRRFVNKPYLGTELLETIRELLNE